MRNPANRARIVYLTVISVIAPLLCYWAISFDRAYAQYRIATRRPIPVAAGGDIAATELTQGTASSDPATSASISPTANYQVIVAVWVSVVGGTSTTAADSMAVSGCSLSWTEEAEVVYGGRRIFWIFRGTSATPDSGCTITMDFTTGSGGTYESTMWTIDEFSNVNSSTPIDTPTTNVTTSSKSQTAPDVGTPGTGDCVYGAVGMENSSDGLTTEAGYTELTKIETGTGVRSIAAAYDCTPAIDETPSWTWSTNGASGIVGFILNKAP